MNRRSLFEFFHLKSNETGHVHSPTYDTLSEISQAKVSSLSESREGLLSQLNPLAGCGGRRTPKFILGFPGRTAGPFNLVEEW